MTAAPATRAGVDRAAIARRPFARRLGPWLAVLLVVLIVALALVALGGSPSTPLDPTSAAPEGSRALVHVLEHYGVDVRATTSRASATKESAAAVVVTAPDAYTDAQLRALRDRSARLVLVRPGNRAVRTVLAGTEPEDTGEPAGDPECADPALRATGSLDPPDDAITYSSGPSTTQCYGGLVLLAGKLAVLGSADVLTNDRLGHEGDAALAVNLITSGRSVDSVVWLRPGADAGGNGAQSLRDLFPPGAFRALWWLIAVAALAALWRARRLGAVVTEPLPVIVRSAEAIEGHGRLYQRASARDRTAAVLRESVLRRLRGRLALPRSTPPAQLAAVVAQVVGRDAVLVLATLDGPAPADDPALARLARDLHDLESAVAAAGPVTTGGDHRAQ